MFGQMRSALGIPKSVDILEHIYTLTGTDQEVAWKAIKDIESDGMTKQIPQRGLVELMEYLDRRSVRKGICTRNFDTPVTHLLTNHVPHTTFAPIITREFRPPKPHPAGILHIASQWDLGEQGARNLIMVGDSIDDMEAGFRAGCATVLLRSDANTHVEEHSMTGLTVGRLDDLIALLEEGLVVEMADWSEESGK
jgi:HAD superfamily hydrolase (TIGR01549 family)